ncbi:MAG: OmpA family protein, partial [Pseudomonadota bacterium]
YLTGKDKDVEIAVQEGRLISRLFKKPAEKSNYEIFKSYEKTLVEGGFEIVAILDDVKRAELLSRDANSKGKNDFLQRSYKHKGKSVGVGDKAKVATQGQEYLAARKTIDKTEVLIVVNTSRSGNYVVEQFETAAMADGTVTLTLENLKKKIESEGRIAIYGIHFDTGSAKIKPTSADTIATVVRYLKDNPGRRFYVVGHTDDQGKLAANMALSQARAQAVVDAVAADMPDAKKRLIADGVGPLSPVATNGADDGRALNRRVELVSTLN